jgi:hypothetical protein
MIMTMITTTIMAMATDMDTGTVTRAGTTTA